VNTRSVTERYLGRRMVSVRRAISRRRKETLTAIAFLLPSAIILGVFVHFSLFYNIYISLTNWNFISATKKLVGFANYEKFFTSGVFGTVLWNTTFYSASTVTGALGLGLLLALLLNRQIHGRGLLRTILFSPYVMTLSAVALLWSWLYEPRFGLVNIFLGWLGISGPNWLRSTTWAMPALIIMNIWRTLGYNMVIYLSGLQAIPEEVTEAAKIDGANAWQVFRHITLPLLSPTTFFLVVVGIIASFKVFTAVAVMTSGGPLDTTQVFTYTIYQQAFNFFKAGYAAAIATIFFVLVLILTVVQFRLQRHWVHYE
jgi:ABC-type sugar transport system permease subunit